MPKIRVLSASFLTLTGLLSFQAPAHAGNGVANWNKTCLSSLKKYYYPGRGWKALAVSNIYLVGKTEWQSCNDTEGYSTKANAITVAMNGCKGELRKTHAPKSASCRVTMVEK